MDKLSAMSKEQLIDAMSAMQAQMNEMSKTLTVLKNELKVKEAKPKVAKPPKVMTLPPMSAPELDEMIEYLKDEDAKLGTLPKQFLQRSALDFLHLLWQDYLPKCKNATYTLSELWCRMQRLHIGVLSFRDWIEFQEFMMAPC